MIARLRFCGEMIMHMLKGEVEVETVDYVIDGCVLERMSTCGFMSHGSSCSCFSEDGRVLLSS